MVKRLEKASRLVIRTPWVGAARPREGAEDWGCGSDRCRPSLSHWNRTGRSPRRRPQMRRARLPAARLEKDRGLRSLGDPPALATCDVLLELAGWKGSRPKLNGSITGGTVVITASPDTITNS